MHKIVLLRHGQSTWNLENRFTGWTDVDLSEQGTQEARAAGQVLKAEGFEFDLVFTSVLKRAIRTMQFAMGELDQAWVPVVRHWRLNERHYGALQGLDKAEHGRQARRRAGEDLAPLVRHPAAAAGGRATRVSRETTAVMPGCPSRSCP